MRLRSGHSVCVILKVDMKKLGLLGLCLSICAVLGGVGAQDVSALETTTLGNSSTDQGNVYITEDESVLIMSPSIEELKKHGAKREESEAVQSDEQSSSEDMGETARSQASDTEKNEIAASDVLQNVNIQERIARSVLTVAVGAVPVIVGVVLFSRLWRKNRDACRKSTSGSKTAPEDNGENTESLGKK